MADESIERAKNRAYPLLARLEASLPSTRAARSWMRVAVWGFPIAGRSERPHPRKPRLLKRLFWIDNAARW